MSVHIFNLFDVQSVAGSFQYLMLGWCKTASCATVSHSTQHRAILMLLTRPYITRGFISRVHSSIIMVRMGPNVFLGVIYYSCRTMKYSPSDYNITSSVGEAHHVHVCVCPVYIIQDNVEQLHRAWQFIGSFSFITNMIAFFGIFFILFQLVEKKWVSMINKFWSFVKIFDNIKPSHKNVFSFF